MTKLLCIALTLLTSPSWAGTWALVQNAANTGCSSGSATCAVTVSSTGSNNLLVVIVRFGNTTDTISSVSDGTSTYTVCPTCLSTDSALANGVQMAYSLASASGKTTITVTKSSTSNVWVSRVLEYSTTAGPPIFDTDGTRDQTSTTTTPAGVTLTLSGTNDVIVQSIRGNTPTAISGSYTDPATFQLNNGYGGWINTNSGTAPTWTHTSSRAALSAIAFKETTGGGGVTRRQVRVIQ